MKKTDFLPRFLSLWLILSLSLPSPALALRPNEVREQRGGLEELEKTLGVSASPTAGAEETLETFRAALKQIRMEKKESVNALIQFLREEGVEQKLGALQAKVNVLELAAPVKEEIAKLLSVSGGLNRAKREQVASVLIYLADRFGLVVEGLLTPTQVPDGKVFLVVGHHVSREHARKIFDEVKSRLPEIPSDSKGPEEIPEIVFHLEDIHPDDLNQLLVKVGGLVKSIDDQEGWMRAYKLGRDKLVKRAEAEGRGLARGEMPTSGMFMNPFGRALYEGIVEIARKGYRMRVFYEDPEPMTWWRWNRSEALGREVVMEFLRGDVAAVAALLERLDTMRFRADQDRDLKEEGPAVNARVNKYPHATHFIIRGLIHSQVRDAIEADPSRKEIVWAVPDPSRPEAFLGPLNQLHELRRQGEISGSQGEDLERTLRLRDTLNNVLATPAVQGGRDVVDIMASLNPILAQLKAEDVERLIRSFQRDTLPMQDRVYETYYRLKAMFPGLVQEDGELDRMIVEAIRTMSTRLSGTPYTPAASKTLPEDFSDPAAGAEEIGKIIRAFTEIIQKAFGAVLGSLLENQVKPAGEYFENVSEAEQLRRQSIQPYVVPSRLIAGSAPPLQWAIRLRAQLELKETMERQLAGANFKVVADPQAPVDAVIGDELFIELQRAQAGATQNLLFLQIDDPSLVKHITPMLLAHIFHRRDLFPNGATLRISLLVKDDLGNEGVLIFA